MEMGYREYARHKGVTLGAVQKALKSGRISVNDNGKIDSEAADRAWESNTDVSRVAVNVLGHQAPVQQSIPLAMAAAAPPLSDPPAMPDKVDAEEVTGSDRVANEYREHRATRERYQALKQQLEYEQLVGTLINVDEARRIAYTAFRGLRDAVMNVAPRIKDQLAAISDPHEVEQILDREHSAALSGIDMSKLLKDQGQDD
jgi:hypothetical protein